MIQLHLELVVSYPAPLLRGRPYIVVERHPRTVLSHARVIGVLSEGQFLAIEGRPSLPQHLVKGLAAGGKSRTRGEAIDLNEDGRAVHQRDFHHLCRGRFGLC